ncbi:MAG: pyrroline-5-carboxylate reductase [Chlamydiae bacterium RIFCSPHIGHO2_12_FULL_49_9]|nr:MAG: pyrroline-5-carboxylate reductase [Chlamydiae bacterium RIFCSPHIGHO2_12_FULL_49_9]
MKTGDLKLGFIGFGHMAQGICRAIDRAKLIPRSQISFIRRDPAKMKKSEQEFGVTSSTLPTLVEKSDLIFICVRPAQLEQVLKDLAKLKMGSQKIITIAAGVKMAYFQKHLGRIPIIRAMPNMGSSVLEGMTVLSFQQNADAVLKEEAQAIFSCMGEVIEVPEELMDISCGLSASGPGFVFRMIEAFAKAGEAHGLPYPKALKMAAQTFAGAARLVLKGGNPKDLIAQIATPNGTTEAGFKVMDESKTDQSLSSAIQAATKRSKELSHEFF